MIDHGLDLAVIGKGESEVCLADSGGAIDDGERARQKAAAQHRIQLGEAGRNAPD